MKILAVADHEAKYYYDYYKPGKLKEFDLILSCGDLDANYLSFLVTCTNLPLLYVHGNHDERYDKKPPEGCICIDDKIYVHNGIRILGLGGSIKYRDGRYMYTEKNMRRRIRRLAFQLHKYGGFDILLTHSPALDLGDWDSPAHRGFLCFAELMSRYSPKYMVHGHVHMNYGAHIPRILQYENTQIINAYERYSWTY